jgi:tetratricopeptide (TPR) repeat protein
MSLEDALRRSNDSFARAVVAVEGIVECSDPVEFEKSFRQVLQNQHVTLDQMYEVTPFKNELEKMPKEQRQFLERQFDEYKDMKKLILQTIDAGYTFDWDTKKIQGVPVLLEKTLGGFMGAYAKFCHHLLAGELIKAFTGRKLSEAERLDDKVDELNQLKRYEEALPYVNRALELSPRFCLAWINKGIALKNLGRLDEAIECYDKVIGEINQNYKKAWYNKAVSLMLKEDIAGASQCVEKALEISPGYPHALKLKIRLHSM